MATGRAGGASNARRAMEFLQSSDLVNLDVSLRDTVASIGKLEEVAGYVIAWERYVLVVAQEGPGAIDPPTASMAANVGAIDPPGHA